MFLILLDSPSPGNDRLLGLFPHDLSKYETAKIVSRKLVYRGYYFRREKETCNKKIMWKCTSYSRTKCHSRIHTFDGHIIFNSDKHNHLPHTMESDLHPSSEPTLALPSGSESNDCHDNPADKKKSTIMKTYSKLSLTKNIRLNLQNITKPLNGNVSLLTGPSGTNENDSCTDKTDNLTKEKRCADKDDTLIKEITPTSDDLKTTSADEGVKSGEEENCEERGSSTCDKPDSHMSDLTRVFDTITELPNSLVAGSPSWKPSVRPRRKIEINDYILKKSAYYLLQCKAHTSEKLASYLLQCKAHMVQDVH
ncbi:hypothetical protein M8J76_011979 [Diaphorina citri]|nr:hypothetical protein M8J76_011979 [Diaphorina citri]